MKRIKMSKLFKIARKELFIFLRKLVQKLQENIIKSCSIYDVIKTVKYDLLEDRNC